MRGITISIAIIFGVATLFTHSAFAQVSVRNFVESDFNFQQLKNEFGKNKSLIAGYELPILAALSYFPELTETKITFRFRRMNSAGLTTFKFLSFFSRNRHFVVTINNDPALTGVTFNTATFNAKVGLVAHELSHVLEFMNMSNAGIAFWAIRYVSGKNAHRKIERSTDETVIQHGLGYQLYDWTNFVLTSPVTSPRYKRMKERFYLQPFEILSHVQEYPQTLKMK